MRRNVKSGWKTTEFWGVKLVQLGTLLTALAGGLSPKWAALAIAGSEAAYAFSRGLTKWGSGLEYSEGTTPPR